MSDRFFGWYFKCQSPRQTLAFIPAVHGTGERRTASVQVITPSGAWNVPFHRDCFSFDKKTFRTRVGANRFDRSGIELSLEGGGLTAKGSLRFGPLSPIASDIMGPFRFVPFMECRHSVVSMRHTVTGEVVLNGETYRFDNDYGYIEGDRGRSFPTEYAWTQCALPDGALFLSTARIPLGPLRFAGVIGVVKIGDNEYRLATYRGARVIKTAAGEVTVQQKDMTLTARLLERQPHALRAPVDGEMSRTIRESVTCRAYYRFCVGESVLLETETDAASFEYEYPD